MISLLNASSSLAVLRLRALLMLRSNQVGQSWCLKTSTCGHSCLRRCMQYCWLCSGPFSHDSCQLRTVCSTVTCFAEGQP